MEKISCDNNERSDRGTECKNDVLVSRGAWMALYFNDYLHIDYQIVM